MPTGYTADISKGITFQQYALHCARAFGALILMRDDPSDASIPERFEPSKYHTEALAVASDRLTQLRIMSPADAESAAQASHATACAYYETRRVERLELRSKYDAMLAQVVAWQAPTPGHTEYKSFMEKQIRESIEWDCGEYGEVPICQSGGEWLAAAIMQAEQDIDYHTKEDAKERERTEGRNGWIKALRDSLA